MAIKWGRGYYTFPFGPKPATVPDDERKQLNFIECVSLLWVSGFIHAETLLSASLWFS